MVAEPLMSIADQIARMKARWPRFTLRNIDRREHAVHWIGIVQPQFSPYTLDVQYSLGSFPKVRVVSPSLTCLPDNPEGQLPHVYPPAEDPTLCLFDPELDQWNWSMPVADTAVPWACDWLACYELWVISGVWRGGGRHAGDPIPTLEGKL
jgi:hypothetical protein